MHVFVCMFTGVHATAHVWRAEGSFQALLLSSAMGPGNRTRVKRLAR